MAVVPVIKAHAEGQQDTNASSVTADISGMSLAAGDLMLVFCTTDGARDSTIAITQSGFTDQVKALGGDNRCTCLIASKVLLSADTSWTEIEVTWSGSEKAAIDVILIDSANHGGVDTAAGQAQRNEDVGTTPSLPAATFQSSVLTFAYVSIKGAPAVSINPAGYTRYNEVFPTAGGQSTSWLGTGGASGAQSTKQLTLSSAQDAHCAVIGVLPASASTPTLLSGWTRYCDLSVLHTNIDSAVTDMPIYCDLSRLGADFWDNVKSDGGDIRVTETDGSTLIPFEYNIDTTSESGWVYYKETPSTSTTTGALLQWGNSGASALARSDAAGSDNVWSSSTEKVLHMDDDPSGSAPQMLDSTSNQNDATSAGSMVSGDVVAGMDGNSQGLNFDGSDDYLVVPDDTSLDLTSLSISLWFRHVSGASTQSLIAKREGSETNYGFNFSTAGSMFLYFWDGASFQFISPVWSTYFTSSQWHHLVGTLHQNGSDVELEMFLDGVSIESNTFASKTLSTNAHDIIIGAVHSASLPLELFNGDMDEVRIYSEVLTPAWIKFDYEQHADNTRTLVFGTPQEVAGGDDYTLVTADLSAATTLDAVSIVQNHVLTPVDGSVTVSLDSTTLDQVGILAPDELSVTVSLDATTITQVHALSPDDLSSTPTLDVTTIIPENDDHTLAPNGLSVSTAIDTTSITQAVILSPDGLSVGVVIDTGSISQLQVLAPNDMTVTTTIGTTLVILPSDVSTASISLGALYTGSVSLGDF